ncbi:hypothetical protein Dimus_024387 [Dionaea muscipula]
MNDNGLNNVMELIKRQKWENLFKRRELVHTDAVKEFYAKMSVIHLKKKDIVKSKVRGVEIEFDHEKLATILGIPGNNGICEYVKDVWEESKYINPLEITGRFANNETLTADEEEVMMRHMAYVISIKDHELPYGDWMTMIFEAFGVPLVDKKGEEPKRYDFFEETFLTMCKLTRENGIWWIGSGENRRRDDDEEAPEEEAEDENEGNRDDFDREVVIDEATIEGNQAQMINFMMLRWREKSRVMKHQADQASSSFIFDSAERSRTFGVDPRVLLRKSRISKFQAEFERKRANRFHDELEKAKAENAKLLALLHQAQTKPHP